MMRTTLLAATGFAVALGAAAWLAPQWGDENPAADERATDTLARRLDWLEASLREEADQRLMLELELLDLREEVARLRTASPAEERERDGPRARVVDRPGAGSAGPEASARERLAERLEVAGFGAAGAISGRRIERLVGAGFSPEQARWIEQRMEELRLEELQARYEAAREGTPRGGRDALSAERLLRQELGDPDYARYLEALSRPSSISVRQVLSGSPAARSGLQPGDEIIAYGGQRVFSMAELNELTLRGAPGQPVLVDVVRDGQQIQLYLPRGPVGIVGGGRLVRRP